MNLKSDNCQDYVNNQIKHNNNNNNNNQNHPDTHSNLPELHVAIGVLFNKSNKILITQRSFHTTYGGYWEFPGGKIEKKETPELALIREIKEELGIMVNAYHPLGIVRHYTATHLINLYAFKVTNFDGQLRCREAQLAFSWVETKHLENYSFPEATQQLIARYLNI